MWGDRIGFVLHIGLSYVLRVKGLNVWATLDGETSFVYVINKTYINENISASGHFVLPDSLQCETHMKFTQTSGGHTRSFPLRLRST